jgi:hypothetical protein
MLNILLFGANDLQFDVATIRHIFQSTNGFRNVRFNLPGGRPIEADFGDSDDATTIGLSGDRETISLRGTSDAALHAALLLQRGIDIPLRIIDTDYSFDLNLSDYSSVADLRAAMTKAERTQ